MDANDLIAGYRGLVTLAHQIWPGRFGTTIPPFENASISGYSTPVKDIIHQHVNTWIRHSSEFDAVLDFDQILHDPSHPVRLLPAYDSGDHLHPDNAGYRAVALALRLETLDKLAFGSARAKPPSAADTNDMQRK